MINSRINRQIVARVAGALGELNEQAVFVGGAVVSIYADDPAADDVRPTKDVDLTLDVLSWGDLENLRLTLRSKGFIQSHDEPVMCRFLLEDIRVDVMSLTAVGWAPANRWFAPGFPYRFRTVLEDQQVSLLPLPYFLASKWEAFNSRGAADSRTSHDFEDVVYLLNYCTYLEEQVSNAPEDVRTYLGTAFREILENRRLQEAVRANLYYEFETEQFSRIMSIVERAARLSEPR